MFRGCTDGAAAGSRTPSPGGRPEGLWVYSGREHGCLQPPQTTGAAARADARFSRSQSHRKTQSTASGNKEPRPARSAGLSAHPGVTWSEKLTTLFREVTRDSHPRCTPCARVLTPQDRSRHHPKDNELASRCRILQSKQEQRPTCYKTHFYGTINASRLRPSAHACQFLFPG